MKEISKKKILFLFLLSIFLNNCAILKLSRYDHQTYTNLVYLKAEAIYTYRYDKKNKNNLRLSFQKTLEYEVGKGEGNKETIEQIKILMKMYNRHLERGFSENNLSNILIAFNIAIDTERLKNDKFTL